MSFCASNKAAFFFSSFSRCKRFNRSASMSIPFFDNEEDGSAADADFGSDVEDEDESRCLDSSRRCLPFL